MRNIIAFGMILAMIALLQHCAAEDCKVLGDARKVARCVEESR